MTIYKSLDEIATHYADLEGDATAAFIEQGRIVDDAIKSGFPKTEVYRTCAARMRCRPTTPRNRHVVFEAFGSDFNPQVNWTTHLLAARTDDPQAWLDRAVDENMSTRQLENAIGNKPTVYLKNVEAIVCQVLHDKRSEKGYHVIEFAIEGESSSDFPAVDQLVLITLVQAPAIQEVIAA